MKRYLSTLFMFLLIAMVVLPQTSKKKKRGENLYTIEELYILDDKKVTHYLVHVPLMSNIIGIDTLFASKLPRIYFDERHELFTALPDLLFYPVWIIYENQLLLADMKRYDGSSPDVSLDESYYKQLAKFVKQPLTTLPTVPVEIRTMVGKGGLIPATFISGSFKIKPFPNDDAKVLEWVNMPKQTIKIKKGVVSFEK